jgi:8-amino-3,8-dideoxy-alpha-D-manno-octulosonate transaminase
MAGFSLNVFKTITAGDGGLLAASTEALYRLAFSFHDQGYSPLGARLEIGTRPILGLNFRMNEVTGALALAQLRKIDRIIGTLREKKRKFKEQIAGLSGVRFRKLNDPQGECGTLLTVLFDERDRAARVAAELGTTTVQQSGWHVYSNMDHVNRYLKEHAKPHDLGACPRTDDILSRAINLSVGVVDAGLGSAFGININSTDAEIASAASRFRAACGRAAEPSVRGATIQQSGASAV